MFNNENKKSTLVSDELRTAKFHIMKNDLSGASEKKYVDDIKIAEDNGLKGDSPFLSSNSSFQPSKTEVLKKAESSSEDLSVAAKPTEINSGFPRVGALAEDIGAVSQPVEAKSSKKSFIYGTFIFVLFVFLVLGGYYVWITRFKQTEEVVVLQENEVAEVITEVVETQEVEKKEKVVFSTKSNFFILNQENKNQDGINTLISQKFSEMEAYPGIFLEFVVVDENNTPIPLEEFMNYFKIYLSAEIMNSLDLNKFSIFLYKDGEIERLGLAMGIKDGQVLKKQLLTEEKKLVEQLNSIFRGSMEVENKTVFKSSLYGSVDIRYINLNNQLNLSLDYAVIDNYLIFATNKEGGRLIIDKISKENSAGKDIFDEERGKL